MGGGLIMRFDQRVQFLRNTPEDDGFSEVQRYSPHGAPMWAAIVSQTASERLAASGVAGSAAVVFVVRVGTTSVGVTSKYRIAHGGLDYDIQSVTPCQGRRRCLQITAVARVD